METRAYHKANLASVKILQSVKSGSARCIQLGVCFAVLVLIVTPHDIGKAQTSTSMDSPSSLSIIFSATRSQAYYLSAVPAPHGSNLLSFTWNISIFPASNGAGSVQFSQNNVTWSNLVSFNLAQGLAQGRQEIDSSWAAPGRNYLRASYNQSFSEIRTLDVFVNYDTTLLLVLSPFILAFALGATIHVQLRRRRQSPDHIQ